jgi:DNA polymerase elongation subunit (family B)
MTTTTTTTTLTTTTPPTPPPPPTTLIYIYHWFTDKNETQFTAFRAYGLMKQPQGDIKTVCVRFIKFFPWCYVRVPPGRGAAYLANIIRERSKPQVMTIVSKKTLYGWKPPEAPGATFIYCRFKTMMEIYILRKMFAENQKVIDHLGKTIILVHEVVDPLLQFMTEANISPAGVFEIENRYLQSVHRDDKIMRDAIPEFMVDVDDIITRSPSSTDVARVAAKKTESEELGSSPLILSFDIECYSTDKLKMPCATKIGDKTFMISCVFMQRNTIGDIYLLSLKRRDGAPSPSSASPLIHARYSNVTLEWFDTETELLLRFARLIRDKNPNVITGYNIFGFDIPYLVGRAKTLRCERAFLTMGMGKIGASDVKEVTWGSKAFQNQSFHYIDADGRLFVDVLGIVKQNYKLSNYKLKTVAEMFLSSADGELKDPLTVQDIFKCYEIGVLSADSTSSQRDCALDSIGRYCIQDSFLVAKIFTKLNVFEGMCESAAIFNVPAIFLYTRGQQIKVFAQVLRYCLANNIVVDRDETYAAKENDRYMGAYVKAPVPGIYNQAVSFDFQALYPSVLIAYNIDFTTIIPDDVYISSDRCHTMNVEEHVNCAHDDNLRRYDTLTRELGSISEKIRVLRELQKRKGTRLSANLEKIDTLTLRKDQAIKERQIVGKCRATKTICNSKRFRFVKSPMGVLPSILTRLIAERAAVKLLMKSETNAVSRVLLNKRQEALKVSTNSIYGALGAKKGYLPFLPGAMVTTFMGRENIKKAIAHLDEVHGCKIIYGDTDSCYVSIPGNRTPRELWDTCFNIQSDVNRIFPPPMKLMFEEMLYWTFMILSKKRYMYTVMSPDGVLDAESIGKKGVLTARRDNAGVIRTLYQQVVTRIFALQPVKRVLMYVSDYVSRMFRGRFPLDAFVITKAVGKLNFSELNELTVVRDDDNGKLYCGQYIIRDGEADTPRRALPAHMILVAKQHERGLPVEVGSRLEYVITKLPTELTYAASSSSRRKHTFGTVQSKDILQGEKLEEYSYYDQHPDFRPPLDYCYYTKMMIKPIDEILSLIYGIDDFMKRQYVDRCVKEIQLSELRSWSGATFVVLNGDSV